MQVISNDNTIKNNTVHDFKKIQLSILINTG